ncbi:MAG: hypothetical protein ISS23_00550 [Nanoarchaeota archaeon]|nr:hypothetical protein [Nanoarchaeota archaeon]
MKRKGQVTLFVILGLVLATSLILLIFFKMDTLKSYIGPSKKVAVSPQVQNIDSFVKECIRTTGYEALWLTGQQGGYFRVPKLSTGLGIPYYFANGKSYMPSKERIEKEISSYMNMGLFFCTKNFVDFPGLDVNQGRVVTKTEIKDDEIVLNVEYPLVITKEYTSFNLKEFKDIKIPVRLGVVYDVIDEIMQEQLRNKDTICLSCLINLGIEKDLHIDATDYGSDPVIFTLQDKKSQIDNEPYEFMFANKYEVKR